MEVVNSRTIIHPSDLDRSLEFYGSQLGLAVAREFGSGPFRGVVFFLGGGFIELSGHSDVTTGAAGGPATPPIALWLQVRDARAAVAELSDRGVPIVRSPQLEPWGPHRGVDRGPRRPTHPSGRDTWGSSHPP